MVIRLWKWIIHTSKKFPVIWPNLSISKHKFAITYWCIARKQIADIGIEIKQGLKEDLRTMMSDKVLVMRDNITQNHTAVVYKEIRWAMRKDPKPPPSIMNSRGQRVFGFTDIRHTFREHFIDVTHGEQKSFVEVVMKTQHVHSAADAGEALSIMSIPVKAEIQSIIARYKPGKGVGEGCIANEFAKTNAELMADKFPRSSSSRRSTSQRQLCGAAVKQSNCTRAKETDFFVAATQMCGSRTSAARSTPRG